MSRGVDVRVYSPESDPVTIQGFTVVVDVLRAFSVSYYIASARPDRYLVVESVDAAFRLRDLLPNPVLVGERMGVKVPGFDYGNSPTELLGADLRGKTVVHTTTFGTRGLVRQSAANEVVVGSFVNAQAIVGLVRARGIERVNVYCTATPGRANGEEDYAFAAYLDSALNGRDFDFAATVDRLRATTGAGFREDGFAPASDFELCMKLDRFDAVLARALPSDGLGDAELVPVAASRFDPLRFGESLSRARSVGFDSSAASSPRFRASREDIVREAALGSPSAASALSFLLSDAALKATSRDALRSLYIGLSNYAEILINTHQYTAALNAQSARIGASYLREYAARDGSRGVVAAVETTVAWLDAVVRRLGS
jgi:2-phosphosulfolactate phosphatase